MAPYLRWIQWVSVYRYAWGAMLASEMDDQTFLFDVDDFEGARVTMQVSGQTYLNTFALDPRNVHRDILALAAMFVLLAGACWLRLHAPASSCLLYTSPSPRDRSLSRMPSSA